MPLAHQAGLGGSERILVVEDDEGVRAAVIDMLTRAGLSGAARRECRSGAQRMLESGASVDLLFTDVVMPGPIPTREFARRAQEMRPGHPGALHLRLYPERHRP